MRVGRDGPSDETEPVLLVEIYNRYYMWSCNGYIILLIVEIYLSKLLEHCTYPQ